MIHCPDHFLSSEWTLVRGRESKERESRERERERIKRERERERNRFRSESNSVENPIIRLILVAEMRIRMVRVRINAFVVFFHLLQDSFVLSSPSSSFSRDFRSFSFPPLPLSLFSRKKSKPDVFRLPFFPSDKIEGERKERRKKELTTERTDHCRDSDSKVNKGNQNSGDGGKNDGWSFYLTRKETLREIDRHKRVS